MVTADWWLWPGHLLQGISLSRRWHRYGGHPHIYAQPCECKGCGNKQIDDPCLVSERGGFWYPNTLHGVFASYSLPDSCLISVDFDFGHVSRYFALPTLWKSAWFEGVTIIHTTLLLALYFIPHYYIILPPSSPQWWLVVICPYFLLNPKKYMTIYDRHNTERNIKPQNQTT